MQGDLDIVDPLVDEYLVRLAGSPDPVEAEMRRYADERDGFPIVGPVVGGLLHQLALLLRARRIFEVGSGFGYSAFWFARALPDGGAVTLTDYDPDHLERAISEADLAPMRAYARARLHGVSAAVLDATACMYTNTPDRHFLLGVPAAEPRVVIVSACSGHGGFCP